MFFHTAVLVQFVSITFYILASSVSQTVNHFIELMENVHCIKFAFHDNTIIHKIITESYGNHAVIIHVINYYYYEAKSFSLMTTNFCIASSFGIVSNELAKRARKM